MRSGFAASFALYLCDENELSCHVEGRDDAASLGAYQRRNDDMMVLLAVAIGSFVGCDEMSSSQTAKTGLSRRLACVGRQMQRNLAFI